MHKGPDAKEKTTQILVTGATGYIGGRLRKALEAEGHTVRCLARRPEYLKERVSPTTEVVQGDLLDAGTLPKALNGIRTAYYLVHSMGTRGAFEEEDRQAASNFGDAARQAGVCRIIYLGGLGDDKGGLSPHLRSRHEVGNILRSSGVPVIEFRASIVLGSGSLSFEMIRALVERLPIMITPRWVSVEAQPIGINDLLSYLVAALDLPFEDSRVFEIGGADVMSYANLMREYARQRGLRRLMIPVPVLTPRLSSLWLGLVTPLYARVGRKLIDSICHPTVVHDKTALEVFGVRPKGVAEAIADALRNEDQEYAETRWSDSVSSSGAPRQWGGVRLRARIADAYEARVDVPPDVAFEYIERIGGKRGWYFANWIWRFRGFLDLLIGGPGMRRGRRDPDALQVGDVLDCWRVEAVDRPRKLRLAQEMKLPGRAWLEFEVEGQSDSSVIRQTLLFDPLGLGGLAFWYLLIPPHRIVLSGMLQGITKACRRDESSR